MSSSRHPVALSIEQRVSNSMRLLAVVMCLPLVDGVFAAIVLGGGLSSVAGIVEVGLLVFAGSATIAVILAEMDATPVTQARIVLGVGTLVVAGAAAQAMLAPTVASVLNMAVFERFAALVVLAVAASTASAKLDEYLPGPAILLFVGLIASLSPAGATLSISLDPALVGRAVAAAGVGVLAAVAVALASPWVRHAVDIDRFRFGSAVALGLLALSIGGLIPSGAPIALAVLLVTVMLAFDPGGLSDRDAVYQPDDIDLTTALSDGGIDRHAAESTAAIDSAPSERSSGDELTADSDCGPSAGVSGSSTDFDRLPWF